MNSTVSFATAARRLALGTTRYSAPLQRQRTTVASPARLRTYTGMAVLRTQATRANLRAPRIRWPPRRNFSAAASLAHGHTQPPKPGEEYAETPHPFHGGSAREYVQGGSAN